MSKDLTWSGVTYKQLDGTAWFRNDGAAETIDPHTFNSFHMDGRFDRFDAGPKTAYPSVTKIVINVPATIVFWDDGTKTVVKCAKNEIFDAEKGVAKAIAKKFLTKQYGRKLTAMTDEAVVKCAEAQWKAKVKLEKRNRKKETEEKHCCWNCKYESLSFWDIPCRNCRTERDTSEWAPEEED